MDLADQGVQVNANCGLRREGQVAKCEDPVESSVAGSPCYLASALGLLNDQMMRVFKACRVPSDRGVIAKSLPRCAARAERSDSHECWLPQAAATVGSKIDELLAKIKNKKEIFVVRKRAERTQCVMPWLSLCASVR